MSRLYLVRHGHAEAGFGQAVDPDLDALGKRQAREAAERLARLGPLAILSSPLARARQTAAPLAKLWNCRPAIESAVGEIPTPFDVLSERADWLGEFLGGSWRDAERPLAQWRESLLAAFLAQEKDTVIFSHYVAINAAVGAALADDRVVVFSPDNCSVTIIEAEKGALRLVEKGREALTRVN
jgi:broad specificity phosphatase PhoE